MIKKKQSLSFIVALSLLLGVLYFTSAYAGPETLGPSAGNERHRVESSGIPAQYFGENELDSESVVASDQGLPALVGQVSSNEKRAIPLRSGSGFDAFNAGYENKWKASFSEKTGKVKILYGARSKQYENGPETVARGFLRDSHTIFGLKQDLSDLKTQKVDRTPERDHVRLQQTYNGIPISGVFVLVHSTPQGQVTMVQNDYIQGFQVANGPVIEAEAAKSVARADLQASLTGATLSDGKVEALIAPYKGGYYYIWKIAIPTRDPFGYWVYNVDAGTGEILYKANEILSLKTGQGRAFKSNTDWLNGKISNVPLKYMFSPTETSDWGFLWGAHAQMFDYFDGAYFYTTVYDLKYNFKYDPVYDKDWFDAVDGYYQLNTVWDWWNTNVVKKYTAAPHLVDYFSEPNVTGYYYPIPTVVNCTADSSCFCNAFYHPALFGAGYPGFAFGNENTCPFPNEDLVIDQDVVRHEYTHAMMDWLGFDTQFGGPVNYYGRSMGEGNGDWFAFLNHTKDPRIATVAWYSNGGYLRYLDGTQMYPLDVGCNGGMPEEHCTGEIWGAYLYDLYRVLGPSALKYVYNSFYYFSPSGGHMPSYPDFYDGIWAQYLAEEDLTGRITSTFKAWGSMVSRGILGALRDPYCHNPYFGTGADGCDNNPYWGWNMPYTRTINTKGNLLWTNDLHEYIVYVTDPGWDLTATVTANSTNGIINPYINLYNSAGIPLASVTPSTSKKATLKYYNIPAGDFYIIRVTGTMTAPARGYYSFQVKVN